MALTRNKIDSFTREEMIEELLKGTLMQIWKSPYMFAFI